MVVYHCIFSAKPGANKHDDSILHRIGMKSLSMLVYFLILYFLIILCFMDCFFQSFISAHIQYCGSRQRSNTPFGAAPQTLKSKLCLWITIYQNKIPQCLPHKALITEESFFYLWLSHFWPCCWSAGESGLYLVCLFLPN